MKKILVVLGLFVVAGGAALAQTPYRLPPKDVVEILDAPPPPAVSVSPTRDRMLLISSESNPPIALLARPYLKLGGVRVDAALGARQRTGRSVAIEILTPDKRVSVPVPPGATIGSVVWAPDGTRFAFTVDAKDGVELWTADAATGAAKAVPGLRVGDVLGAPFQWMPDSRTLLVRAIPAGRGGPPEAPQVPIGPNVEEVAGKVSKLMTFQDLLRTPHDEALFDYFGTSRLMRVDTVAGASTPLGEPGLFTGIEMSPDEKLVLVTRLKRPFSYRVPFSLFTRSIEVWDSAGARVAVIADLPISDETPPQGVPVGPRSVQWQPLEPATLVWAEALDGGDPLRKVPHRDRLMASSAPFTNEAREIVKVKNRFQSLEWTARKNQAFVTEFDRDRRWTTTSLLDATPGAVSQKVLFDLSANDAYNDPGDPLVEPRADGTHVMLQDGDTVYLSGNGASDSGDRPFVDAFNLVTLEKRRLWRSAEAAYERFLCFWQSSRTQGLVRHQTKTEPPNLFLVDLSTGERRKLTDYKDPAPQLTGMRKELIKYARADGVQLSGTLYLPPGHKDGTRLPAFIWAYPLEYSDPGTAGQIRSSPHAFTQLTGASPIFFVTQGYAVLNDATMPVIGSPETMNDTFVDQIVASAKAAIDKLDEMGVIDRSRVCVGGHSYGAFMTANLLAHCDLFAAGIARSGAYNRSLTPFGFQSERRSYWEATDVYTKLSPFTYANRINEPLLLIHGEADNNPGTHTIQSERLFQALRGNGGTARLVLLPHESHGYRARESILHVLAEMFDWADRFVKNKAVPGH